MFDTSEGYQMSTIGKLFLVGAGAWLLGKPSNLKLRGTREELEAVKNVLLASKSFQDELKKDGATVESVMQKLDAKNTKAEEFKRITNLEWPF